MKTRIKFPRFLRAALFAAAITCLLLFSACDQNGAQLVISSDTYSISAGDAVDIDELRDRYLTDTTEALDETESADTAPTSGASDTPIIIEPDTIDSAESQAYTVYWVKNGEVWHTTRTCSTLSRSKTILSGTVEEAMLAGKDRVCKRCGG